MAYFDLTRHNFLPKPNHSIYCYSRSIYCYSRLVKGENNAAAIINQLLVASKWFIFEPRPDDEYEITVKIENEAFLDSCSNLCNC